MKGDCTGSPDSESDTSKLSPGARATCYPLVLGIAHGPWSPLAGTNKPVRCIPSRSLEGAVCLTIPAGCDSEPPARDRAAWGVTLAHVFAAEAGRRARTHTGSASPGPTELRLPPGPGRQVPCQCEWPLVGSCRPPRLAKTTPGGGRACMCGFARPLVCTRAKEPGVRLVSEHCADQCRWVYAEEAAGFSCKET